MFCSLFEAKRRDFNDYKPCLQEIYSNWENTCFAFVVKVPSFTGNQRKWLICTALTICVSESRRYIKRKTRGTKQTYVAYSLIPGLQSQIDSFHSWMRRCISTFVVTSYFHRKSRDFHGNESKSMRFAAALNDVKTQTLNLALLSLLKISNQTFPWILNSRREDVIWCSCKVNRVQIKREKEESW